VSAVRALCTAVDREGDPVRVDFGVRRQSVEPGEKRGCIPCRYLDWDVPASCFPGLVLSGLEMKVQDCASVDA
jgi:hypothetical protein